MKNISHTSYRILGPLEHTLPFWETLSHIDCCDGCIGLRAVAGAFGIPARESSARGNIWSFNFFPNDEAGLGEIHLETETEREAPHGLLAALCGRCGGRLSVSYLTVNECRGEYAVHDEADFFGFTHYVSAGGSLFEHCDGPYESLDCAVHEWCSLMRTGRGGRSDEEMMQYINAYLYGCGHWHEGKGLDRFVIHPFAFE